MSCRKVTRLITEPNQLRALDFIHDTFGEGRMLRMLSTLNVYTKESLKIFVATPLNGRAVIETLEQVIEERGKPRGILSDNGPKFTSYRVISWQETGEIS